MSGSTKMALVKQLLQKGQPHHERIPYLRNLPLPAIAIVALLVVVNMLVWAAVGVVLVGFEQVPPVHDVR